MVRTGDATARLLAASFILTSVILSLESKSASAQQSFVPVTKTSILATAVVTSGIPILLLAQNPYRKDCVIQAPLSGGRVTFGKTSAVGTLYPELQPGSSYNCANAFSVDTDAIWMWSLATANYVAGYELNALGQ